MHVADYNKKCSSSAFLSNEEDMTSFQYGDQCIRFRTSPRLERYTAVKEWDKGYLVVMAQYKGVGEVEEYIDLIPILHNLYIEPDAFLKSIKSVEVNYAELG